MIRKARQLQPDVFKAFLSIRCKSTAYLYCRACFTNASGFHGLSSCLPLPTHAQASNTISTTCTIQYIKCYSTPSLQFKRSIPEEDKTLQNSEGMKKTPCLYDVGVHIDVHLELTNTPILVMPILADKRHNCVPPGSSDRGLRM